MPPASSDREVQDLVIRALADARFRRDGPWRALALAEPERVERFARFLCRRFYHSRLVHLFGHSRALAPVTGRSPEEVVRGRAFGRVLATAVLGSRETAAEVARLAGEHVASAPRASLVPYLDDLLRYEEAMMVVEAGPRDGTGRREEATRGLAADVTDETILELTPSCVVVGLAHDLTRVLPVLAEPCTIAPAAPPRRTWFVVSRTPEGRVSSFVVRQAIVEALRHADGRRILAEVAGLAGLRPEDLARPISALHAAGAIALKGGA